MAILFNHVCFPAEVAIITSALGDHYKCLWACPSHFLVPRLRIRVKTWENNWIYLYSISLPITDWTGCNSVLVSMEYVLVGILIRNFHYIMLDLYDLWRNDALSTLKTKIVLSKINVLFINRLWTFWCTYVSSDHYIRFSCWFWNELRAEETLYLIFIFYFDE